MSNLTISQRVQLLTQMIRLPGQARMNPNEQRAMKFASARVAKKLLTNEKETAVERAFVQSLSGGSSGFSPGS